MSLKKNNKRSGKVTQLHNNIGHYYSGGIYVLADETGVSLDELFMDLLQMCIYGAAVPIRVPTDHGRFKLIFQVAENEV